MKEFVAEEDFWELFPDAEIAVLVVDGIRPTAEIEQDKVDFAAKELRQANQDSLRWIVSDIISKNPVVAEWRGAYRRFKTKGGARCSLENLLKRNMKGNPVGHINPSVDLSNAVSLRWAFPMGVENVDAIVGTFRLHVSPGGESFTAIGADEPEETLPGEVAYVDDEGAVCRCWNWRDGIRTEATDETPHCMFIMECLDPERSSDLHEATEQMAEWAKDVLGATVTELNYVTRAHPKAILES